MTFNKLCSSINYSHSSKQLDMRNTLILLLLFLFLSLNISAATYYVSPGGSDSNPGTSIGTAWATWQYGMTHIKAGDILYIRAGTYNVMYSSNYGVSINSASGRGVNGTAGSRILVSAYPGDANPVLDCSALTGGGEHDGIVVENTQYWDFTGLTVINTKARGSGQPSPGWTLSDCSHITLNQCVLHDNDNGFISYWGNDVHYNNCDSYRNGETSLYFGNNGFYGCVKGGGTTYWTGCRAYLNGQDGFDSFAQNGGDGFLYWDKCWAFSNATYYGASSGFKQGLSGVAPTTTNPMRILTNCIAADMPCGFDESQDPEAEKHAYSYPHAMYNCVSYGNDVAFAFDVAGGIDGKENTDIVRNCISYSDKYVSYIGFGNNTVDHNSWNIRTMTSGDFQSTDISQLSASRQADGSLPVTTFMHLSTSATAFIDAGTDVGMTYAGKGPDIGAYETQSGSTTPVPVPVYTSSVVENTTPLLIQMTYSLSLASVVPPNSAFNVLVNSVARAVNSVLISGTKVQLTLASAIKFGDIVTVSYTKPSSNPLQTVGGGQASSISNQSIINNLINPTKDGVPGVITMTITPYHIHRVISVLLQYSSTFSSQNPAMSPQIVRIVDLSGRLYLEKLLVTGIPNIRIPINLRSGVYNVLILSGGVQMASQKIVVY